MTILYADDDKEDYDFLCEALNNIDPSISCIPACDGREALDLLKENEKLPDFIFLDINMPVMDGKKCLIELKKNNRFKDIPVIMYSTTNNPDEINYLYSIGASSFVSKPHNLHQLHTVLNNIFSALNNRSRHSSTSNNPYLLANHYRS
jgi:CheY-like chemotaxis protein